MKMNVLQKCLQPTLRVVEKWIVDKLEGFSHYLELSTITYLEDPGQLNFKEKDNVVKLTFSVSIWWHVFWLAYRSDSVWRVRFFLARWVLNSWAVISLCLSALRALASTFRQVWSILFS